MIPQAKLEASWEWRVPLTILLIHFVVVIPTIQFFFRGQQWASWIGTPAFYGGVVFYLVAVKRISPRELGWSTEYLRKHLLLGGVLAAVVVGSLPLLDGFIEWAGLDQAELFQEAPARSGETGGPPLTLLHGVSGVLLLPLLKQMYFSGFLVQSFLKKLNPVLAVYLGGVVFTLAHLKLNLGLFALGLLSAYLFKRTGTLYAPLGFHMGCAAAGLLLPSFYPRTITLLSFLF